MPFAGLRSLFEDSSGTPWLIRRLFAEYGYDHANAYVAALALGAVAAACTAGTAYIVGTVVNQAYLDQDLGAIAALALLIIAVFAIKGLAVYGSGVILARIGYRIIAEIQRRVFDKLLLEGVGYFADRHSTQFSAKMMRGARAASDLLKTLINALGRDILTLVGLAAVMVMQDPLMAMVGLLVLPVAVYIVRGLMRRTRDLARSELSGALRIYETIQETIRGFPLVKAFSLEREMRERINSSIAGVERKQYVLARLEHRAGPIMESLGGIAVALVLLYGGYRVIELGAKPGEFVSFITAFLLAYEPAKRIARLHVSLARTVMAVRQLFSILDSPVTEPEEPDAVRFRIERGEIRFNNVNFRYRRRRQVLHDLSFTAEAGEMTALVGQSGGGKSTVIALILRFYQPQGGSIEVDGVDIRRISRRSLREQIAYVGQDVFLFRGSIRENIAFGRLDASEDAIVEAARAAHAHDFISEFPDGYDTEVGEGGSKLSAGQRQRIAIARALLRNAPIILLDEATSSLDSKAEREVQLAIERLREGRTCIAIAHRLHTVMQANRIYVMEKGRIIESGTHKDLLRSGGYYAGMLRLQRDQDEGESRPRAVRLSM
jgi:ATP-binding cassette subfamily B protein